MGCLTPTQQVVLFSSTAIALYGYDQGMMSLINTNHHYLRTMSIPSNSPIVGVIVSIYYLGCAAGAVIFSKYADRYGRKKAIFLCLFAAALGNLVMFVAGLGYHRGARAVMMVGRVIMGLGVGGVDAVIPIYSAELSADEARGKALAKEFQMNIFGLCMAFGINLAATRGLGKDSQWAWRIPIISMQVYPVILMIFTEQLPESPRWFIYHERRDDARTALEEIYGEEGETIYEDLIESHEKESGQHVSYLNMFTPGHLQFHATFITIMCQINQALTGYGAVSVYGPQIFELFNFGVKAAENWTMANYISYLILMTFAWILIDALGRRVLMIIGSAVLTTCFLIMTLVGGLAMNSDRLNIPDAGPAIPGIIALFVATGAFGIGWLATVWLIPTEIFPTTARAQAAAISVIVWGFANFAITLLTPIMFNNLKYFIFLVFAGTNAFAGIWTYLYLPESGNRSFEENQEFFTDAREAGSWRVGKVEGKVYKRMPYNGGLEEGDRTPLLRRVEDQVTGD
ncbi:MFS monosaccharide transporter-like protein [Aulographum hederae CBS 113979]|uniref:MFS monosaccharide transporter-like protein n=1 Tax=Aulographum hederae CBS 113979 TaxID=1176131 RepID=A0A6G1HED9_9PEZI|nr:MFS monosaccharide transporter-like protein [Aulographum hederae CBS 113979]